jgi:hypothetical protein
MGTFWRHLYAGAVDLWKCVFHRPRPYRAIYIENDERLPKRLSSHTVYIVGVQGHEWLAEMVCPCGCSEALFLNLLREELPNWQWRVNTEGAVTLNPSVRRKIGCRSHFFLREGFIQWCDP